MNKIAAVGVLGMLGVLSGCAGSMSEAGSPCPADLDGDGYVGAADLCPHEREDGVGPEPRDGCPARVSGGIAVAPMPTPTMQMIQPRLPVLSRARIDLPPVPSAPSLPPVHADASVSVPAPMITMPGRLPVLPRAVLAAELAAAASANGSVSGGATGSMSTGVSGGVNAGANGGVSGLVDVNAGASVNANVGAGFLLPRLPVLGRATLVAELNVPAPTVTATVAAQVVPEPPRVDPPKVDPPKIQPPKRVEVVGDEIKINEKILFETASATIDKKSDEFIQTIAKIIIETPDLQFIEIAGHADKRGSEQMNKDLTHRRAEAVMKHLIADGVVATKLRAVGYGSFCPLDPGETEEAFDKNRRVEFRILRRGGVDSQAKWGGCDGAQKKGMAPQPIPSTAPGATAKTAAPVTPVTPAPGAPGAPSAPKPATPATPAQPAPSTPKPVTPTPPAAPPKKNP